MNSNNPIAPLFAALDTGDTTQIEKAYRDVCSEMHPEIRGYPHPELVRFYRQSDVPLRAALRQSNDYTVRKSMVGLEFHAECLDLIQAAKDSDVEKIRKMLTANKDFARDDAVSEALANCDKCTEFFYLVPKRTVSNHFHSYLKRQVESGDFAGATETLGRLKALSADWEQDAMGIVACNKDFVVHLIKAGYKPGRWALFTLAQQACMLPDCHLKTLVQFGCQFTDLQKTAVRLYLGSWSDEHTVAQLARIAKYDVLECYANARDILEAINSRWTPDFEVLSQIHTVLKKSIESKKRPAESDPAPAAKRRRR